MPIAVPAPGPAQRWASVPPLRRSPYLDPLRIHQPTGSETALYASATARRNSREWEPAFDAGVGVDLGLGNRLGLGAGVWYHRVMDDVDGMGIYTGNVGLRLAL